MLLCTFLSYNVFLFESYTPWRAGFANIVHKLNPSLALAAFVERRNEYVIFVADRIIRAGVFAWCAYDTAKPYAVTVAVRRYNGVGAAGGALVLRI